MRDDRDKWEPSDGFFAPVTLERVTFGPCTVGRQYLVSQALGPRAPDGAIGWPDVARGAQYRLRLRRDQFLDVGGDMRATGWQDESQSAVSDACFGYQVFELQGDGAFGVLCAGAEIDLALPSRSVSRQVWDLDLLVYRYENTSDFRIHVARSHAHVLYQTVTTVLFSQGSDF